MGWSESYYTDMKNEAERELRKKALPLLKNTIEMREAMICYGEFSHDVKELDALLERLQVFLEGCLDSQ